jgi:hypothetical protein
MPDLMSSTSRQQLPEGSSRVRDRFCSRQCDGGPRRTGTPTTMPSPRNSGRMVVVGLLVAVALAVGTPFSSAEAGAAAMPARTTSRYEASVNSATLNAQGRAAGWAGTQGLVILDFGRPAVSGSTSGTMDFNGSFVSLDSIVAATMSYVQGYFASAPPSLRLDVAIGTNNSCGTGQPCGGTVCGCKFEPPNFAAWGARQAAAVEQAQSEATSLRTRSGFTDVVTVVAGDDAEPAFDPGYQNTYDLLAGYANAVGGYQPAMIDFGSAERGFWSSGQLLQIADRFKPNLAVPETYFHSQVSSWASLASYAETRGRVLTFFGVLTNTPNGGSPQAGYSSLLNAIQPITGQTAIRWTSNISR